MLISSPGPVARAKMSTPLDMLEATCTGLVRRMVRLPRTISRAVDQGLNLMKAEERRTNSHHFQPPNVPFHHNPHHPPLGQPIPQNFQPDWGFLAGFEQQYGLVHPFFYACRFIEVLKMAQDEHKLVFLYLHSPDHPFTPPFCKDTLCSEVVVEFLDANFVSWGGLADRSEGLHLATTLRPASFPFCAIVAPGLGDNLDVLQQMEGPVTSEELVETLQTTLEEHGRAFSNTRAKDEEKRRADIQLRQEQDAAYSASLQADQVSLPSRLHDCTRLKVGVNGRCFQHGRLNTNSRFPKRLFKFFASVDDLISDNEIESDDNTDQEDDDILTEGEASKRFETIERSGGRPGLISFYNQPYRKEPEVVVSTVSRKNETNLLWFVGPAVLVASFIFPSLYMRRILSTIFEDSLLTDFLILFFTEALFYCGVAMFLLIIDHLRRPNEPVDNKKSTIPAPHLVYRVTSVAALVLSLMIPMVTMGLVWPWTGPAASATLAPYLVGIVVQFAFEQYARYIKSPSWPLIPVIFQVYRLHQLNRAAQLVTALSFTVRGAETTPHNLAINSSLGTLLNVLQCLGVICIWSLSSFLMRFLPSATITEQ